MKQLLLALIVASGLLLGMHVPLDSQASSLGFTVAQAANSAEDTATGLRDIDPESYVVYVTKTGQKYHLGDCRYLKKSKIETTLAKARKKYSACSVCKPPQ